MNESWNDTKVDRAEKAVVGSIDRLEHAMESLTEKVEGSSQKLQHVVDLGVRQKDELLRLKSTAEETILPIYRDTMAQGRRVISSVRADPRPYLYGAAVIVGGLILMTFLRGRRSSASAFKYDESAAENWAA